MKPIPGFEGRYSITEDARVYSHLTFGFINPRIVNGYYNIRLRKSGETVGSQYKLSRLMGLTYLGLDLKSDLQVDHGESGKLVDSLYNLRLLTFHDNILAKVGRLGVDTETHKKCYKCQELKLREEFNKQSSSIDGLKGICKPCVKVIRYNINKRKL